MGEKQHLFEYLGTGSYRYLGPGYPYSGEILERPRGTKQDRVVGEWLNGRRRLYDSIA